MRVTQRIHALSQALWTGGLVAIDVVETPARFRAERLDRNQVGAVGRAVFAAFNAYEMVLAAVSLTTLRGAGRWRKAAVAAMATAAATQFLSVRPQMQHLGEQLDFEDEDRTDPRYAAFQRLHNLYVSLDLGKLALGLASLVIRDDPSVVRHRAEDVVAGAGADQGPVG